MTGRLAGKVALITGGAGGCGLAASELFAAEGAKVGIVDLPQSKGEEVARQLREAGHDAIFAPADVSDARQVQSCVEAVTEAFGPITVLMNHAGVLAAAPFLETSEEEWDRIMAVNVKSMVSVRRTRPAGESGLVLVSTIDSGHQDALYQVLSIRRRPVIVPRQAPHNAMGAIHRCGSFSDRQCAPEPMSARPADRRH